MNNQQKMVREFHKKFGYTINNTPMLLKKSLLRLRADFISEESDEFHEAVEEEDLTRMADALGDLLYFVNGTGVALGIDLQPIFLEIHRSNMTKAVAKIEDGKGDKTKESFSPPNIKGELEKQCRI